VRRFIEEGWNSGSGAPVADIVADGYETNDGVLLVFGSDSRVPHRTHGARALTTHIAQYHEIYDNLRFTIERMIVDGDTVITVWSPRGTTKRETFTNRSGREEPFELKDVGVSHTVVVDGKVTRHDLFWARYPLSP
jgi:ketosteroid isomerase-like protein